MMPITGRVLRPFERTWQSAVRLSDEAGSLERLEVLESALFGPLSGRDTALCAAPRRCA